MFSSGRECVQPLSGVWCCAAARAGSVCGRTPVTMFAYAHANRCALREVSNDYTTDSRQHTRLGRPKRQPANSTAEEENLRRNQRPLARRPLRSWAAQHETSVRRTSRKRPRPSRAPQEVTRKTLRRAQTGREHGILADKHPLPANPASNPHAHRVHVRPPATLAPSYPLVPPHAAHVRSVHVAGSFA